MRATLTVRWGEMLEYMPGRWQKTEELNDLGDVGLWVDEMVEQIQIPGELFYSCYLFVTGASGDAGDGWVLATTRQTDKSVTQSYIRDRMNRTIQTVKERLAR